MGSYLFLAQPAAGYDAGPVMVVTGTEDGIFCPHPAAGGNSTCEGVLAGTRTTAFPDLEEGKFGYYAPRDTGHDLTLHYSAGRVFGEVAGWLEGVL